MSEVRLIIRDAQQDIYANRHGSFADHVMAALSAEPETIAELDAALERFNAPHSRSFFHGFTAGIDDRPYDAGVVVVDLAARLVACDSTYSSSTSDGEVLFHDGHCATDVWLRYHLSDDWKLSDDVQNWRPLAEVRRQERLSNLPLDARAVLYGNRLLEFMARECLESFHDSSIEPNDENDYRRLLAIHAEWLSTPQDDLRGLAPRDVMLAKHTFIDWDLQDRADQWSQLGDCPRGLDPESAAFRWGGFGTHEIVIYYDLVRSLLWSCLDAVRLLVPTASPMLPGDFLTTVVPQLAQQRDAWLDSPDPEFHGRTPRSVINHERARLPEAVSASEAIVDHDCPLCQMQADMPGPMFWHLDGCNMDDDFAFSFHRTRDEWEAEQREYEEFSRRWNAEEAERAKLGMGHSDNGSIGSDEVWTRSFSVPEDTEQSTYLRLFAIGSHLAELTVDLKETTEDRELIDRLSRNFSNLREVTQSSDLNTVDALLEPVTEKFCQSLDAVAEAQPELQAKCLDLQDFLRRFTKIQP